MKHDMVSEKKIEGKVEAQTHVRAETDDLSRDDTREVPEMIIIREAARRTGLSYDFLRKACLRGEIVHIRAGTKFLINFGKLTEWLNSSKGV